MTFWYIEFDLKTGLDILKSISLIIASSTAIYGINSWRRESKWKRKYELAEEVLSFFYEVEDAISIIRNPFGHTNEGKKREKGKNERSEDSEIFDRAYVVFERFEENREPFNKLRAIKYRFITVFGKESEQPFIEVVKLTNKILTASSIIGRYWRDQGRREFTDEEFKKHLSEMHKYEGIIWERYNGEHDVIISKLDEIMESIENICNKVLKKK